MKIQAGDIIFIGAILIFFISYFFFSQKIYSRNKFLPALLVFILIGIALFYFNTGENHSKALFMASVFGVYLGLLLIIKKNYNAINHFLIKRKLIHKKYSDKDFTMVQLSDWGDQIWDKKNSAPPSWLDHLFSTALFMAPFLVALIIV